MKKIFKPPVYIFLFSFILLCVNSVLLFAQDSASASGSSQTTTSTTTEHTAIQPWVWIVGGVILLLIIIALLRGKSGPAVHTDKVTYTKTTSSDDNP